MIREIRVNLWLLCICQAVSGSALQTASDNAHTCFVPSDANSIVLSSFVDYLKVEKGLAALTVSAYTRDIVQFAAFLDSNKRTLLKARRDDVRGFIQQCSLGTIENGGELDDVARIGRNRERSETLLDLQVVDKRR